MHIGVWAKIVFYDKSLNSILKKGTKCFAEFEFQIRYDEPPKKEPKKSSGPTSHRLPANQRQRQSSNTPRRKATGDTVAPGSFQTVHDSSDNESSGSDDEPQNNKVMTVMATSNSLHI